MAKQHGGTCIAATIGAAVAALLLLPAQAAPAAPPVLRGLAIVPSAGTPAPPGDGIQLAAPLPVDQPALQDGLSSLLGRPVGPELLSDIRRILTERFVASGHPFTDISVPPQDITDGRLRVIVREYRVGSITVAGNRWFTDRQIMSAAGLAPGGTIDKPLLDRRLASFGASPFVKVTPGFKPGTVPGTTDVTLLVADRLPVQAFAAYRDNGVSATGVDRFDLGVRWGDVFHTGATLGYTVSTSSDFWTGHPASDFVYQGTPPRFLSQQLSATQRLDDDSRVSLFGAYTRQNPSLGPDLGSLGVTTQISADYSRPAPQGGWTVPGGAVEHVGVTADFKRTNNNLSFGGLQVQRSFTVIAQVSLHASAAFPNALGKLLVSNILTVSPGGLTRDNTDGAFQPAGTSQSGTPGAHARYAYDRLTMTELAPLPSDFGLVLRATAQAATCTLLASEQMSIAGIDAVRGYQEFGAAGSQGVLGSAELRSPAFTPSAWFGAPDYPDAAQLHVFADAGRAWNPTGSQIAPAAQATASLGVGGTLALDDALDVRIEQGWQLLRASRQGAKGAFLHAEMVATW